MKTEKLELKYVTVEWAYENLWERNPNPHAMDELIASIKAHGFKDAPHYDTTLSAIDDGNGRVEALYTMMNEGYEPPRGVYMEAGEWLMPVMFGVDGRDIADAIGYALDVNSVGYKGAGMSDEDIAEQYESDVYLELIQEVKDGGGEVVTVDDDVFDRLYEKHNSDDHHGPENDLPEPVFKEYDESQFNKEDGLVTCPSCGENFKNWGVN